MNEKGSILVLFHGAPPAVFTFSRFRVAEDLNRPMLTLSLYRRRDTAAGDRDELGSTLEEAAEMIHSSGQQMAFVPRIATVCTAVAHGQLPVPSRILTPSAVGAVPQLDITRAHPIASRYDVFRTPTLLLFAEKAAIDGEEYTLAKTPKAISNYLIALATKPDTMEGKKHRVKLEKAALDSTVQIKSDGVDQFFDSFWKTNNCASVRNTTYCVPVHGRSTL